MIPVSTRLTIWHTIISPVLISPHLLFQTNQFFLKCLSDTNCDFFSYRSNMVTMPCLCCVKNITNKQKRVKMLVIPVFVRCLPRESNSVICSRCVTLTKDLNYYKIFSSNLKISNSLSIGKLFL